MKPSFALSLSFSGIRLLHRAAGGWRVVGDVALDAGDMAAELAVLRKTANALEPGSLRSKVLLPNEQIKYLTIDTPGQDAQARHAAAVIALEGATPYAVADLAFDISSDGDKTHIAAVARETLAEAEGFAQDHKFQPVSFAAIPDDQPYLGEPFFGTAAAAATILEPGETVEPDGIAVVVIGDIEAPKGPVVPDPQELPTAQEPTPELRVTGVKQAETQAEPETPSEPEAASEPEAPEPAAPPSAKPAVDPAPAQPPLTADAAKPAPVAAAPALGPAPTAPEEAAPATVGFASRRAVGEGASPKLQGVQRAATAPSQSAVTDGHILIEDETTAPPAAEKKSKSGFLSRRAAPATPAPAAIPTAPPPANDDSTSEQERMTVFGARKSDVGGKPRFLGLILTAALLVFLAGVAAWASVFLDDGMRLSRIFGERAPVATTAAPEAEEPAAAAEPDVQVAALDPGLTEEDAAVLDALREPLQPALPEVPTEAEIAAAYAASGIWPRAPQVPPEPAGLINIENLYITSIDPVSTTTDAVALPAALSFDTDVLLAALPSPAAAGTAFALDDRGLVIPTAQGALSPDGFTVVLGAPPLVPPATPTRFQSTPEDTTLRSALAAARPEPRPADLVERTERAQLDGLTKTELASYRPALRPRSLQQQAEADAAVEEAAPAEPIATDGAVALALAPASTIVNATKFAVQASARPDIRPRNFARIVQRAQRAAPQEEVRVASAAAVAPRTVAPKIPSKASVAKQATVRNALNLRKVNLIGVYGKPSSRRALVRLGNGRYKKVVVGDRIDGGRVSAIGEGELRYTKRGRDLVLKMPR